MKKKIICVGTTLYRIVNRDCHYSPIRGIGRYYTVNKKQLEKLWYFDEMMKVYINIKRNSNLRLHQPFNKRIGLMKKERTHRTLHYFFGASGLMKRWWTYIILVISLLSCQLINSSDFHPPTSLSNKRTEENATIRRLVGHPTCLLSDQPTREDVSYQWKEKVCLYRWYSHRLLETKKP